MTIILFCILVLIFGCAIWYVLHLFIEAKKDFIDSQKDNKDLSDELSKIKQKYSKIEDKETYAKKIDDVIRKLENKKIMKQIECQDAQKVLEQHEEKLVEYRKEESQFEESNDLRSYGFYKPHYDFDTSEQYKIKLELNIDKQKNLVKTERAAICNTTWTVGGSEKDGKKMIKQATKMMLRAFNGESDAAVANVKYNNIHIMESRINKTHEDINKMGTVNQISITDEYLNLKIEELRLTHEYEEKKHEEKEEQRKIREIQREEEKEIIELEKAQKEAEQKEKEYQKALEKARAEQADAKGKELDLLNQKIQKLETELKQAQDDNQRAISMAQKTKSGHVYIISNVGSFGENIFKIGMTRRLDPIDRIIELSGASVPFTFDVHAMMYSENAPELESKMHNHFNDKRVNMINNRKEFFNISIDDICNFAKKNNIETKITKLAEAREYRETLSIKNKKEKP